MLEAERSLYGEPKSLAAAPSLDATGVARHLRAGAALVVLCGVLTMIAANGLMGLVTPRYTSTVQLLIDPAGLHILDRDVIDRRPRYDSGVSLVDSQVRVIRSDSVLRRVVRELDLGSDPEFASAGWLDRQLGFAGDDDAERALDTLQRSVTARRPDRTLIVDVYVETRDAAKSARIAEAVMNAYLEEEADSRSGTARRITGSIEGGLPGLKAAVADVEARILRYRQENGLATADGIPLGDRQLTALNQESVAAALRTAEARERLEQARRARPEDAGSALPEMLQSRELRGLRQQHAALSASAAELATRLGQRHPALTAQAAQEADLRRQMQREKERIVDSLRQDYERVAASEVAIRARAESAKAEVADNDRAEVGLRELNRELAARREVYAATLRRSREIGEQGQIDSARVRVISPPSPATRPSWPPARRPVLVQSFALGLLIGVGLALLRGTGRDRRRFAAGRGAGSPVGP